MAEYLHFSRDSKLYVEKDGRLWYIPVLDGFNFSQSTNTSEITLSEMEDVSGRSRRGRKMFTDSLAPTEWNFSTYVRPFFASTGTNYSAADKGRADDTDFHHTIDEVLWVSMAGRNEYLQDGTFDFDENSTFGGPITSITVTNNLTNNATATGSTDFAVDADEFSTGVAYANEGKNAAVNVAFTTGTTDVTVTVTEAGLKFRDGETITINGGDIHSTFSGDIVITVTSESLTRTGQGLNTSGSPDAKYSLLNFKDSNRAQLGTFNLYFVFSNRTDGRLIYKVSDAMVNECTINFDVDGLATQEWSGFGSQITDVTDSVSVETSFVDLPTATGSGAIGIVTDEADSWYIDSPTNDVGASGPAVPTWIHAIDEGTAATSNFIRNRITQLSLQPTASFRAEGIAGNPGDQYATSYNIPLTGGSFTISNNGTYLTPEELGIVNQPIEHVTGTRSVTANFTCYLGSSDIATNRSKDLFDGLVRDNTTVINEFEVTFKIGGIEHDSPRVYFTVPLAHLEVPSFSVEDVITLEANMHGQGTTIGEADEVEVKFFGVAAT